MIPQDMMSEIETDEAARHRAKMVKRKQVQDAEEASKTIAKGLLMVNTRPRQGQVDGRLRRGHARTRARLGASA